jgi:CRISPR-associated protein Csc1
MSKAELKVKALPEPKQKSGSFLFSPPLNPLDVMFTYQVFSYDVINMPPVSLIRNIRLQGDYYEVNQLTIPARMEYRFQG